MQHPEESLWCHTPPHNRPEMNPQAEEKTDGRNADEEPKEGSYPIWDGVRRRGKVGNRGRRTILLQNLDVRFEQCRTGRACRFVVNCNGLVLKVSNELPSVVLRGKFAPVAP